MITDMLRILLALIMIVFILSMSMFSVFAQTTPNPVPTIIPSPQPTFTPILYNQMLALSTEVADLDEKINKPSKDVWDILDTLSGFSTLVAAVLVGILGTMLTRHYDEKRNKADQARNDLRREDDRKREEAQEKRDQIHRDHELSVAQAQTVQIFIPLLEQKGKAREAALLAISELGNTRLSSRLSKIYVDEKEDPEFVKRQQRHLKNDLVIQAKSADNTTALMAIEWMRSEGWLENNSRMLIDANLGNANLQGANLTGAYLKGVFLFEANLQGADLAQANLEHAILEDANLMNINLTGAYLKGTSLIRSNLQGANLAQASLEHSTLQYNDFDSSTILPDDKPWTPETDLERYTDPEHPDFWQPDWVKKQNE